MSMQELDPLFRQGAFDPEAEKPKAGNPKDAYGEYVEKTEATLEKMLKENPGLKKTLEMLTDSRMPEEDEDEEKSPISSDQLIEMAVEDSDFQDAIGWYFKHGEGHARDMEFSGVQYEWFVEAIIEAIRKKLTE